MNYTYKDFFSKNHNCLHSKNEIFTATRIIHAMLQYLSKIAISSLQIKLTSVYNLQNIHLAFYFKYLFLFMLGDSLHLKNYIFLNTYLFYQQKH